MSTELRTFFGDPAAPLYGTLHRPDSGSRAAVLICSPLGKQQVDVTRGLRLLGDRLSAQNIAMLRFDYPGTGESAGVSQLSGEAVAWVEAVDASIAQLRGWGFGCIAVLGLGVGALIASQSQADADYWIWWEPAIAGRRYVREQSTLASLAFGTDAGPGIVGADWHDDTAKVISGWSVRTDPDLLIGSAESLGSAAGRKLVESAGSVIETESIQPFLSPDSFFVDLPRSAIDRLTQWCASRFPMERVDVTPTVRSSALISTPSGPVTVTLDEHDGAVVWVTDPADGSSPATTLVSYATANDLRSGPARLWVDLGRTVAAAGGRSIRFDRSGVGEAGAIVEGDDFAPLYSEGSVDHVAGIVERFALGPTVHVGVCSGAWYASMIALRRAGAGLADRVIMVNPLGWRRRMPEIDAARVGLLGLSEPGLGAGRSRLNKVRTYAKPFARAVLPYQLWVLAGRMGVMQVPHLLLTDLVRAGVPTELIFSPADYEHFGSQRGDDAVRKLARERRGPVPTVSVVTGDHPALHPTIRAAVRSNPSAARLGSVKGAH